MGTRRFGTKIELKIMEKNDNYFDNKSESEKMRNVANMVNDIVNATPDDTFLNFSASDLSLKYSLFISIIINSILVPNLLVPI